jgi:Tfp pilus assembly PilM family ATPase
LNIKGIFQTLKGLTCPIGLDMGENTIKLVQLCSSDNGNGIQVVSGGSRNRPNDIKHGGAHWQHWCLEVVKSLTFNNGLKGREVIAAMPAREVFIDNIKVEQANEDNLQELAFKKVKQKLPFEADDAVVKCIPSEEKNVVVIATERKKIDRYLAVFEKASLNIHSIGIWPLALINTYVKFFARRQADLETVVILIEVEQACTNIVVCRHKNLLFAHSIPIGAAQLEVDEMLNRLILEIEQCKRQYRSLYKKARLERLIFLSGQSLDKEVYTKIAKQMELPAQIGDCLAAVEIQNPSEAGIERRNCKINWSTAFGLSLS